MSAAAIKEIAPSMFYEAVTPSDTVNFTGPVSVPGVVEGTQHGGINKGVGNDPLSRAIFVGVGGNMVAIRDDDTAITFTGVVAGTILAIRCKRINNTSTTATDMVALF